MSHRLVLSIFVLLLLLTPHTPMPVVASERGPNLTLPASMAPDNPATQNSSQPRAVTVNPGDPIHKLVNRAPGGTTFIFAAGVHRIQQIQPKNGQSFIGVNGTILSGAVELHGFKEEGTRWVLNDQPKRGTFHGVCAKNPDRSESRTCQYSQDLFVDGVALALVESLAELTPGHWYYDQKNERIYVADNPETHALELSITMAAFVGTAQSVTIRGLTIEKFANPAQFGAIHNYSTISQIGRDWVVEQNNILLNHGIGVRVDEGARVRHNHVHHNGQLGIAASGKGVVIENNELAYNNTRGFSYWWEAGGSKFVRTQDLIVRQNHVHHNIGPGLWTDGYNINALYQDNVVEDNQGPGIFHEISYNAVITDNRVSRNGFSVGWYMGAGILIAASSDVEVKDNRVINNANGIIVVQQDRGNGPQGLHQVKNVYVHDNYVGMTVGASGLAFDPKYTGVQTANGNRFNSNTYEIGGQRPSFVWLGKSLTKDEWLHQGQDLEGTFLPHP